MDRTIRMSRSLPDFFRSVTGEDILPYQAQYGADPFTPTLLNAPTGLGKTDAVLLPWLHAHASAKPAPTRLAFTLPRQSLTEQVARIARRRVDDAHLTQSIAVLELMGGSSDNRLTLTPDQPAILIGTQDILLSRALNRGYARNPFRWPIDFALLNNDCLWILDELQLMSDGLATTAQLAAFRDRFGAFGSCPCVWMSATADPSWLGAVDFSSPPRIIGLSDADRAVDVVRRRIHAPKSLSPAPDDCRTPDGCAAFALSLHLPGQATLVIVNTVARAVEIARAIHKRSGVEPLLLHSRFRPAERAAQTQALQSLPPEGRIIVSTQVVEAGIDFSAHRLITDLAPWSSLVQRCGRVNRRGDLPAAEVHWIDPGPLNSKDAARLLGPYSLDEVAPALVVLNTLSSASPADLPAVSADPPWRHVLRRADILDLFDTSPDLAGQHIDVSRFIRSGDERDVYLAWRSWPAGPPPGDTPALEDAELCPVPIGDLRAFAKKRDLFFWSFLDRQWTALDPSRCYPGMKLLARAGQGGYTGGFGWSPSSKTPVTPVEDGLDAPESTFDSDSRSFLGCRQTLFEHTAMVVDAMRDLLARLPFPDLAAIAPELEEAAALHDWGKAHEVMQRTLHGAETWDVLLGKQQRGQGGRTHSRPRFRHELASALAILQSGGADLAAYLAAAHHGRTRLTLRSVPGEKLPSPDPERAFARGVWEGDALPACDLAPGVSRPPITLSLAPMELGESLDGAPSWTARALRLRERFGPFRLAFLELLLRAADEHASRQAERNSPCQS
jgi:CRISPR-associated endonuclease/helicase Cas3